MKKPFELSTGDYQRLIRALQKIGASLHVDDILQYIIDAVVELCRADQVSIMLLDPETQQEAKTLIRQDERTDQLLDHFLNTLLSGAVQSNGEPFLTDNVTELFTQRGIREKYQTIAAILSVPLTIRENIIGVINLISLDKKRVFRKRELHLLEILASQCAQFVENARLHESLFVETQRLRKEVRGKYTPHGVIGKSPKMREVFALLERVIPTDGRVLIGGESGTGKELIARMIHYGGPRKEKSFVAVDCGALPANILESELFGYTRGAFTGANRDKKGLFEEADSGTLFLDEITNMPTKIQSTFLRAIQEGEIRPLGSNQVKKVDVRIISASSSNLAELVKDKTFRQDLFYRLNVITVTLPPLRERRADIIVLADHFLRKHNKTHGKKLGGFKPETVTHLENYAWPGNVRELENAIERMVILAESNLKSVPPELLPQEIRSAGLESPGDSTSPGGSNIHHQKDSYERERILSALQEHQWNQSAAARALGIAESSLRYKLQKYQIRKP